MRSVFRTNTLTSQVLRLALAGALILNSSFVFGQTFNQAQAQKILRSQSSLEILGISEFEFNSANASKRKRLRTPVTVKLRKNFFPDHYRGTEFEQIAVEVIKK